MEAAAAAAAATDPKVAAAAAADTGNCFLQKVSTFFIVNMNPSISTGAPPL
jgi:hypothetical protein